MLQQKAQLLHDADAVLGHQSCAGAPVARPLWQGLVACPERGGAFPAFLNVLMAEQLRQMALPGNAAAKIFLVADVYDGFFPGRIPVRMRTMAPW